MKKLSFLFIASLFLFTSSLYATDTKVLLKTEKTWDNTTFKPLNIAKPEVTVLYITINKGEKLPLHKHIMTNIAYVVKGKLRVTADNGKYKIIEEGDCLSELINTYHYGENLGDSPVELVVFYLGEKDAPLSILK